MVNQLENSFAVFKAQARPARRGLRGAHCAPFTIYGVHNPPNGRDGTAGCRVLENHLGRIFKLAEYKTPTQQEVAA